MRDVVLASGNAGKRAEIEALLAGRAMRLIPQRELGVHDAAETASTFIENALLKARHAAALTGLPAIADDSGLCVAALGGAPGVRSARYAGDAADDAGNIARLLDALAGVPETAREARFVCVAVLLAAPDDADPIVASGRWEGRIAVRAAGGGGFGYDPVFVDAATGLTAAELEAAHKNRISHRAAAFRGLVDAIAQRGAGR